MAPSDGISSQLGIWSGKTRSVEGVVIGDGVVFEGVSGGDVECLLDVVVVSSIFSSFPAVVVGDGL